MEAAPWEPGMPAGCRRRLRAAACGWLAGLLPGGTAGSDSGKATTRVIRRGPFHHHHQPARHSPKCPRPSSPHHPAERRLVVLCAALANRHPCRGEVRQGRVLLQAVRRHHAKIAPDRKLFSARAELGQRGREKSICDRELDIKRHAWAVLRRPGAPLGSIYEPS
jgi:hypothetical protein